MDEEHLSSRHSNYAFIFLIAVCILLLTAHLSNYIRGFKNLLFYIVAPTPQSASRFVQSGQKLSENLSQIVNVHQENIALKSTLAKYAYLENQFIQMKAENERLKSILGISLPKGRGSITAKVSSREPSNWFQSLGINKGSNDGIIIDAPVIVTINNTPVVLGRVGEVSNNTSKVILLTNVMSAIPAMARANREDGLLEGQNSGTIKLNYMTKDVTIKIGDEIVTSPLSYVFPPDMLIGKVVDIITSKDESFTYAIVRSEVNLNKLREVVVLVNK